MPNSQQNQQNQNPNFNNQKDNASNAPKAGKDQDPRRNQDLPRAADKKPK